MLTIHQLTQGSSEWHEIRVGKYTGSNAFKLLRYGAIEYARAQTTNFKGNFYTKRGHILEDEAIELYDTIQRCQSIRPGFITNSRYETCGYSPDGIDGICTSNDIRGILLEVKCFNEKRHLAMAQGEIPSEIIAQIHFGLLITGLRQARLIIYNPDIVPELALKIIEIKRNENIINNFKKILKEAGNAIHTQTANAR